MASLGDAILYILANNDGLNQGLSDAETKTKGWAGRLGGSVGKLVGGAVVGGAMLAVGAIVGIGKAAMDMEGDFDNALDAIIAGTGASGEALDAMGESVRYLKTSSAGLGVNMEQIGTVMAEVSSRTGATGQELENFTGQVLQYSRLTGGDAVKNTELITRTMGDWGVSMEDSAGLMDMLYGAGQAFGIKTESLSSKLVQFGAPLRQMGFSLEDSAAMFGKWEKEGVNAELVIGSLRIAAGKFADEGVDLGQGLADVQDRIKGAASDSDALTIAMETFGARAGPDMAAAIREGRFELGSAIEALRGMKGGLDDAAARTLGFREQWEIGMAKAKDSLIPLGVKMGEMAGTFVDGLIDAFVKLIEWTTPVLDGVIALADYFGEVVDSGNPLNEFLGALPGPLQGVAAAFGNVVAWVQENWPMVQQVVGSVVEAVAGFFRDTLGQGVADAQGRFAFIKAWIDENMPLIRQTVKTVLDAIVGFWNKHGNNIMYIVERFLGTAMIIVDTVMQTILGIFRAIMLIINGDWKGAWEEVSKVVDRIFNTIITVVGRQLSLIKEAILLFAPSLISAGGALIGSLWEGISTGFSTLITKSKEKLAELRALLPFSEPKDPSSPLRGLARSGEAIVGQIQMGLDRASLNLGGALGAGAPGMATAGANITINNTFGGTADAAMVGSASRSGVLSAMRAAGMR